MLFSLAVIFINMAFAQNQAPQLINWFAGADIVGSSSSDHTDLPNHFVVREFEFSAFSTIDQTFDGILTLSYHNEQNLGEEHFEVHEAFLFSSKLLALSTVKMGKFFLGFGRLNRFHRHDWIFTEAPMVQKAFFGNEGVKDTGFEIKRNIPASMMSVTFGITSGDSFNHNEDHHHHSDEDEHEIEKAKAPTSYFRLAKFYEYSTQKGFDVGLNFVTRNDKEAVAYQYAGLDFVFKDRTGRQLNHLAQLEAWYRDKEGSEESTFDSGAYLYYQYGLDWQNFLALRLDYFKTSHFEPDHNHAIDGLTVENEFKSVTLSYIYENSEFMKTRFNLEHGSGIHSDDSSNTDFQRFQLQLVFNIGAHPAHVY